MAPTARNSLPTRMPETEREERARKLNKRIMATFFVTLLTLLAIALPASKLRQQPIFSVFCILFLLVAFLSSFLLFFMHHCCPASRHLIIGVICLIGFSEMCTIGGLLFLLKISALVAIILPLQMFLVVGMVVFHGQSDNTNNEPEITPNQGQSDNTNNEPAITPNQGQSDNTNYETEIDNISELSLITKTLSFGLLSALILMDEKNISDPQKRPSRADLSMTYLATTLCLCPVMISSMPLPSLSSTHINILKVFNYATLVPLAGVAMVLAAEFLNELVVLSFTPLLVACLALVCIGGLDQLIAGGPKFIKDFKAICVGVVAALYYATLVAAHCAYVGENVITFYFKVFVYILLVSIISGLILTPQVLRPATSCIPPIVINVLCCDAVLMVPIFIYAVTDTKIVSNIRPF